VQALLAQRDSDEFNSQRDSDMRNHAALRINPHDDSQVHKRPDH
jgi:hypothetical protein